MNPTKYRQARVNTAVGLFLVLSAIGIYLFLDDSTYAVACFIVGMVIFARAISDVRIASEE